MEMTTLILCCSFNFTAYVYTVPVVLFSFLYNLPRFFEWKTVVETYEIPCYTRHPAYYEAYDDDFPHQNESTYDYVDYHIEPNCTEVVRNVSLIPMELRKNEIYIAVRRTDSLLLEKSSCFNFLKEFNFTSH